MALWASLAKFIRHKSFLAPYYFSFWVLANILGFITVKALMSNEIRGLAWFGIQFVWAVAGICAWLAVGLLSLYRRA